MKEREEVFSNKILCGTRTYFFDIKQSKKGDYYLKISEKRKLDDKVETHQLMVFGEDAEKFIEAFTATADEYRRLKGEGGSGNLFSEHDRDKFSFKSWTLDEDDRLRNMLELGKTEEEIAELLGRRVGAVIAREKKLGLI